MPRLGPLAALIVFLLAIAPGIGFTEPADTPEAPESIEEAGSDDLYPDAIGLLAAADELFSGQDIESLSAKLVVYRDPADQITLEELRQDRVEARTLVPLQGKYEYWAPNHYNFYLLGYLLASSEVDLGVMGGMTSPLLPLPGGILSSSSILDSFRIRVTGIQEYDKDGEPADCYVVRLHSRNRETAFFKSLTYYITVDEPHMVRGVRATFSDGGGWTGTGWGTFYYLERGGRTLPFVGLGQINFRDPDRRIFLKGKWRDFKVNGEASVNPDAIREDAITQAVDRESTLGN